MNTTGKFSEFPKILAAAIFFSPLGVTAGYAVQDNTPFVNMVQDAAGVYKTGAHRTTLMRYPCGRIGSWSIDEGEIADCVSRGLRLYPCIGTVTNKGNVDWRDTISGDPSVINIRYRNDVPAKGSTVELTVTPHVSCYRYHLASGADFKAITLTTVDEPALMNWNSKVLKWTTNNFRIVDDRTVELTLSGFKKAAVYYYIKFSAPSVGKGTLNGGTNGTVINDGAGATAGARVGGFLKFNTDEVTVGVAVSDTSMERAKEYFDGEFADMNFGAAAAKLKQAWIARLGRIEAAGPELAMKQLYTGLYTIYVNVIDVTDNPNYKSEQPLLTIASSDFWQYVGGFPRCDWDQSRIVYPLLSLIDPELLGQILNTYQAQFDRDGKFAGDWCPFADNKGGPANFAANIALLASLQSVPGVDYAKFKESAKTNAEKFYNRDFFRLGYIPVESKDPNCASHTLEYGTQLQGLAILARTLGDAATYDKYYQCRTNYENVFDSAGKQFRSRNADGTWGPPLKKGFFEGSAADWGFAVPHDPYGLFDLAGSDNAVTTIEEYVGKKSDFNDYKLIYEYLPIFADRADVTERLVRTEHVPKFSSLTMAEGLWGGPKGCYYSDNAGPLVCGILGLYWIPTSGATWLITTPSVDRYVIHGKTDITVETINHSPDNNYIKSIQLNGAAYPSFEISGRKLVSGNQTVKLSLTGEPSKIGGLYLSSTDGEVLSAAMNGGTGLSFDIDPMAVSCTAKVYSLVKPSSVTLNGARFTNWTYDAGSKLVTLTGMTKGSYRVAAESRTATSATTKPKT